MRRYTKLAHELGAAGFVGAVLVHLALLASLPPPEQLAEYATQRAAIARVGSLLLFPSLFLVLFSGIVSIIVNRAFHNAGWAWFKFVTGISIFEGTLVAVHGPAQRAAEEAAAALAGELDPAQLGGASGEGGALWVLLFIAVLNFWLGVFRPRFSRRAREVDELPAAEAAAEGDAGGPVSP